MQKNPAVTAHLALEAEIKRYAASDPQPSKADLTAKARELAPNDANRQFVLYTVALKQRRA